MAVKMIKERLQVIKDQFKGIETDIKARYRKLVILLKAEFILVKEKINQSIKKVKNLLK